MRSPAAAPIGDWQERRVPRWRLWHNPSGPVYLAGALAFANNWFTTDRTALGEPHNASFQGQDYAARLEGSYRFAVRVAHDTIGITPYAAIEAQDFHTPSYSETDVAAGGFGPSYDAMNGTDTRSEFCGSFDDLTTVNAMPLILRARVAWAHDWVSNPALNASFESLPGTIFTVFGAPIPHDSALASASAQLSSSRRRVRLRRADLRRLGNAALHLVSGAVFGSARQYQRAKPSLGSTADKYR